MSIGFNPDIGIAGVQTSETQETSLPPKSQGMSPALSTEKSVPGFEIYAGRNLDALIDAALRPSLSNPDLMRPDIFNRTLKQGLKKLSAHTRDKTLKQLSDRIHENTDLLQTYENLVIAG